MSTSPTFTPTQADTIALADLMMGGAGLPSYTELLTVLAQCRDAIQAQQRFGTRQVAPHEQELHGAAASAMRAAAETVAGATGGELPTLPNALAALRGLDEARGHTMHKPAGQRAYEAVVIRRDTFDALMAGVGIVYRADE